MTPLNQLKAIEFALEATAPVSVSQPGSGMRSLFLGLRVGWRLLIVIGLMVVLFVGTALVLHGGPQGLRNALKQVDEVTVTRVALLRLSAAFLRLIPVLLPHAL